MVKGTKLLAGFDTATPGTFTEVRSITGIGFGEKLEDLDYRWHPSTALDPVPPPQLFALAIKPGLAYTARIYTIDIATGAATPVGSGFETTPAGTAYGIDFNPTSDRIRVVNDFEANFRINPDNGSLAGKDGALTEAGEKVTAVAYDRAGTIPLAAATGTTAFALGSFADALYTLGGVNQTPSPNVGNLLGGKPIGVVLPNSSRTGFDIDPDGTAYATLNPDGLQGLYTLDLATGAATLVGKLPEELTGLAIVPPPAASPPAPPAATPDRTAPRVSLDGVSASMTLKRFLKGISIEVTASEPAGLEGELRAAAKSAKLSAAFNLVLAEASATIAPGKRTLKLKPRRKLVGQPAKKFKVSVRVTAIDAAKNSATATKSIVVKPPAKASPARR